MLDIVNTVLGIFLPSGVFVFMENATLKNKLGKEEKFGNFVYYLFFINILSYFSTIYIFKNRFFTFTDTFTFKYLVLSFVIGLAIFIIKITGLPNSILKNLRDIIHIELRLQKHEKNKEEK